MRIPSDIHKQEEWNEKPYLFYNHCSKVSRTSALQTWVCMWITWHLTKWSGLRVLHLWYLSFLLVYELHFEWKVTRIKTASVLRIISQFLLLQSKIRVDRQVTSYLKEAYYIKDRDQGKHEEQNKETNKETWKIWRQCYIQEKIFKKWKI